MIPLMKNAFLEESATREALASFLKEDAPLSMGKQCAAFESGFASFQGRKHAVLFNSGASANLALLQACINAGKLRRGANIGFSSVTWATNVMPIIQLQMLPVPLDCSQETLNVMSSNLEERLSDTPLDAVFITNALGFTGDLEVIRDLCNKKGILLLEDNCESLGTALPEGYAGNFGLASTFSFYIAHHMSTIEGGMVCTDDDDLSDMLRLVRANGWDRNLSPEAQARIRKEHEIKDDLEAKYSFYDLGFNLRPTEITGLLGNMQLNYLPSAIEKRALTYEKFAGIIANNPDLIPVKSAHLSVVSNFALPILCKTQEVKARYLDRFLQREIELRPIIAGNMQNQPFYKKYVTKRYPLPGADFIQQNGFYCGNCPDYTEGDLSAIFSAVGLED